MPEHKPYTFSKTHLNVFGEDFTTSAMEAGIVVNQSIGIRFLWEERANLYIMEFIPLQNLKIMGRFEEPVLFKQSYRYEDQNDLTFLFRTGEKKRGRALFFQLESKAKGIKFELARKLSLTF